MNMQNHDPLGGIKSRADVLMKKIGGLARILEERLKLNKCDIWARKGLELAKSARKRHQDLKVLGVMDVNSAKKTVEFLDETHNEMLKLVSPNIAGMGKNTLVEEFSTDLKISEKVRRRGEMLEDYLEARKFPEDFVECVRELNKQLEKNGFQITGYDPRKMEKEEYCVHPLEKIKFKVIGEAFDLVLANSKGATRKMGEISGGTVM
ncbi:MAG: hypothetical protein AB1468_03680, partial [Candidatus Micrarchaeota archaeon]